MEFIVNHFFINDLKFIHLKIDLKKNNYLITLTIYINPKQLLNLKALNYSTILYLLTLHLKLNATDLYLKGLTDN